MSIGMQSHRDTLNDGQLTVLELLNKFRFGSSELIASYFGKSSGVYLYKRLNILVEKGLVGKRYDSSYRLRGWPVAYYLKPDGIRIVEKLYEVNDSNVALAYKSVSVSDDYMRRSLQLFGLYNDFKKQFGSRIKFFTKNDMVGIELPDSKPDAYLLVDDRPYLLDICHANQLVSQKAKLRSYAAWIDRSGYETGFMEPTILLACDEESTIKKMRKALPKSSYSVVIAYTTISDPTKWYVEGDFETPRGIKNLS